ncbi:tetratricopeptide repeat protein, partial [Acinetobacter baumannii]|uniref:tetratricopeptide repeat protein n=1 Tax=Acinetobacter baumannii TaxID=470 RepID=UPI002FF0BE31
KNNFPEAQYNLGLMYDNGYYVNKDRSKALEFYKLSSDQGYAKAQYNLANIYSDGSLVKQDNEKALELYIKVAEKGVPEAQNNLAYMYANVYSDYEKAKYWFRKAADN